MSCRAELLLTGTWTYHDWTRRHYSWETRKKAEGEWVESRGDKRGIGEWGESRGDGRGMGERKGRKNDVPLDKFAKSNMGI